MTEIAYINTHTHTHTRILSIIIITFFLWLWRMAHEPWLKKLKPNLDHNVFLMEFQV